MLIHLKVDVKQHNCTAMIITFMLLSVHPHNVATVNNILCYRWYHSTPIRAPSRAHTHTTALEYDDLLRLLYNVHCF